MLYLQHTFIIVRHFNHIDQCSSSFCFLACCTVTKTTTLSCINDMFYCYTSNSNKTLFENSNKRLLLYYNPHYSSTHQKYVLYFGYIHELQLSCCSKFQRYSRVVRNCNNGVTRNVKYLTVEKAFCRQPLFKMSALCFPYALN